MASSDYLNRHFWYVTDEPNSTVLFDIRTETNSGKVYLYTTDNNKEYYSIEVIKELINCLQHAVNIASPKKEVRVMDLITGIMSEQDVIKMKDPYPAESWGQNIKPKEPTL